MPFWSQCPAIAEPLNVGRKTRTVPTAIKRALRSRDKGCVFPGCSHQRFVAAHHIRHWSAEGETSLANLLLLCTRHHRLVHEGGFSIAKDYLDRWYFRRPDGIAVPQCGYRTEDTQDDDIEANCTALGKNTSAEWHPNKEGLPTLPLIVAEREPPAYLMKAMWGDVEEVEDTNVALKSKPNAVYTHNSSRSNLRLDTNYYI